MQTRRRTAPLTRASASATSAPSTSGRTWNGEPCIYKVTSATRVTVFSCCSHCDAACRLHHTRPASAPVLCPALSTDPRCTSRRLPPREPARASPSAVSHGALTTGPRERRTHRRSSPTTAPPTAASRSSPTATLCKKGCASHFSKASAYPPSDSQGFPWMDGLLTALAFPTQVERALERIFEVDRQKLYLFPAGRTDTGVHATGQVRSAHTTLSHSGPRFVTPPKVFWGNFKRRSAPAPRALLARHTCSSVQLISRDLGRPRGPRRWCLSTRRRRTPGGLTPSLCRSTRSSRTTFA